MSVLVLLLAGPLQSWGSSARFARRTTEQAPTKSGVIGILAAALGRDRAADISDLAALRFGVRIDQPGTPVHDFQTAHHFETGKSMPVSDRFYLADAVFVAAVEGEPQLIDQLDQALQRPRFLPYLGRRSCPPARPINLLARHDWTLEQALKETPWQAARWHQRRRRSEPSVYLEIRLEATAAAVRAGTLRDQPLSFDPNHRRYALRAVHTTGVAKPNPAAQSQRDTVPDHDPTTLLGSA